MEQPGNEILYERNYFVKITCFFWLITKLITYKLWIANRLFPIVPPLEWLHKTPAVVHHILLSISLLCLAILFVKPSSFILLIVFFASEILSCVLDQNRWQPWEYQFLFTILIIIFSRKKPQLLFSAIFIILISTYFFSGINKIGTGFLEKVWSRMILVGFFRIPRHLAHHPFVYFSGYIIPLIEASSAVGLLFLRTRKPAAISLILMHLFNLLLIGPIGLNYNTSIWPWNVLMIFYLQFLFLSKPMIDNSLQLSKYHIPIILFWIITPVLYLFGMWDTYLSSSLYSGKTQNMIICFSGNKQKYPENLKPYFNTKDSKTFCKGGRYISVTKWSMNEMKVPCYPERRIFMQIKNMMNKRYPGYHLNYFIKEANGNTVLFY